MKKVIVFDYDGVINPEKERPSIILMRNHPVDKEEVLRFFTGDFNDCLIGKKDTLEAIEKNISNFDPKEFMRLWHKYHDVLDEEMVEVMKGLQDKGFGVCIATNQDSYRTDFIRNRLAPFLDIEVYSSCDFAMEKKDPEFFEILKNKLGVEYDRMIFIDDSETSVNTSKSLGIESHLFTSKVKCLEFIKEHTNS